MDPVTYADIIKAGADARMASPVLAIIGGFRTLRGLFSDPSRAYDTIDDDVIQHVLDGEYASQISLDVSPNRSGTGVTNTPQVFAFTARDAFSANFLRTAMGPGSVTVLLAGCIVRVVNPRDNAQATAQVKLEGVTMGFKRPHVDDFASLSDVSTGTFPNVQESVEAPAEVVLTPDDGVMEAFISLSEVVTALKRTYSPVILQSTWSDTDAGGGNWSRTFVDALKAQLSVTAVANANIEVELCFSTVPGSWAKGVTLASLGTEAALEILDAEASVLNAKLAIGENLSASALWDLAGAVENAPGLLDRLINNIAG